MIVELISVGTEILLGDILNTNVQYLSKRLAHMGMNVYFHTTVGDNPERIRSCLDIAFSRSDMVIMTGGLGPTKDDLTKEMLMEYFGKTPVFDQKAFDMMEKRLEKFGHFTISDSLRKQAYVPSDSLILYNYHGTAPGCVMEKDGKACILLPGPPKEMEPMFEQACEEYLSRYCDHTFVSVNIKMIDKDHAPLSIVGEGPCADRLDEILDGSNPTTATYAKEDGCLIRITASAKDHDTARAMIEPVLKQCIDRLGAAYIRRVYEEEGEDIPWQTGN